MAAAAHGGVLMEIPLGTAAPDFNLEKAVCSHGLFMMAPNHWDSRSKTLTRPLRLSPDDGAASFVVRISHRDQMLHIRVLGTRSLSPHQQQSLQIQVKRMLRLSEEENRRVKEFHEVHSEAKSRGFGRVFRSPTLFEDMVKCILLCNCQWPRTLSMAQALCELQLALQHPVLGASNGIIKNETISSCQAAKSKHFAPETPARKESKKCLRKITKISAEMSPLEVTEVKTNIAEVPNLGGSRETGELSPNANELDLDQPSNGTTEYGGTRVGNFPSPEELARLNEEFLAQRCNLGYRAGRVINLARGIMRGEIQLNEFENACNALSLPDYTELFDKLSAINGFGPFTCANVLTCMGFYHIIPTDSETIRHLKQVHGKRSSIKSVDGDLEEIYGKYAPFQFLAYWCEVWHFYEEWFGNLSEMPDSNYRLITAANMKPKKLKQGKSKNAATGMIEAGKTKKKIKMLQPA